MNTAQHTGEEWAHPLFLTIQNEQSEAKAIAQHVRALAAIVNRNAARLASANAEWHDDPAGDPTGHAEMHAPAEKQFPEALRQAVLLELVEYYATDSKGL